MIRSRLAVPLVPTSSFLRVRSNNIEPNNINHNDDNDDDNNNHHDHIYITAS